MCKMKTVLHVMNYGASYRGNFMDSLKCLDEKIRAYDMKNIYLFCSDAKDNGARIWISKMQEQGEVVEFLTGSLVSDVRLICRLIKKYRVAIVHTHFTKKKQQLAVIIAAHCKRTKIIAHFHNHSLEAKNKIKKLIRRLLYSNCNIIACSESVYLSAERDYPGVRKCFVDNGVNFDRLDSYSVITNEEYGIADGEKICLIFGFDFYRKGVDLAVQALQKLREKGYRVSLLISLSTNFDEVEENIIKLLGEKPEWIKIISARNDVATLYNYVDLFLSPSREEGLPYSVIEAAYSRCSVVLSDISAQANLRIQYGYWFPDGDVDAFAEAIVKAVEERNKKIVQWDEVKSYMRQQYSLDIWSMKITDIYKRVMNDGKI